MVLLDGVCGITGRGGGRCRRRGTDGVWEFEAISHLQKQFKNYPDEVSHPRILRWLDVKGNPKIKDVDLFKPSYDAVVHPWIVSTEKKLRMTFLITLGLIDTIANPMVEFIKKELAGATVIRSSVRKGQPSVEALHDQTTAANSNISSRDIFGGVDIGGRHADISANHDFEHINAKKKNMFENTPFIGPSPHYTKIIYLMRGRQLAYLEAYETGDRIMDLEFYRNLKDKYNYLSKLALTPGGEDFIRYFSGSNGMKK
ncbi:hypothetical protein FXO38_30105 [Capsicum annuum]|nr:hypothetical protein FXO38_30105 [Capsicum annuum]